MKKTGRDSTHSETYLFFIGYIKECGDFPMTLSSFIEIERLDRRLASVAKGMQRNLLGT